MTIRTDNTRKNHHMKNQHKKSTKSLKVRVAEKNTWLFEPESQPFDNKNRNLIVSNTKKT